MKIRHFARTVNLLVLLLIAVPAEAQTTPAGAAKDPPLSAEQKERLKERARVLKEVNQLLRIGKHAEALALWEKEVALERKVFGRFHKVTEETVAALAQLHGLRGDFAAQWKAGKEALAIRTHRCGPKDWRVKELHWDLKYLKALADLDPQGRRQLQQAVAASQQVLRLKRQGQPRQALPLARAMPAVLARFLGEKHPLHATTLNNLALVYQDLGEYTKALPLVERVKDLFAEALGTLHPKYAGSINNLAVLYQAMGQYRKALPLYEQARDVYKQLLGDAHPLYATTLNNLGALHKEMGHYATALSLYEKARALRQKVLGESHPEYAISLNNLAMLYREMGKYHKALTLLQQSSDLRKRVLGETHPLYATSLGNLALLYHDLGDHAKALTLHEQARDLREKVLGKTHPDYLTSLHTLANLHQERGEYGKAVSLLEQARELRAKALGQSHPNYADTLSALAVVYRDRGEYHKALSLLEQAKEIYKQRLGESHLSYAATLNNVAALYRDLGEYARAVPLMKQANDLHKQALGESHPAYATSLSNLATVYREMGEYGKALPLLQRASDLRAKMLGTAHRTYAISLGNLGNLYRTVGEYGKALPLLEQARELRAKALGKTHPDYAQSLNNLAALYQEMGEYRKALPLYEQARDLSKRLLGEAHPAHFESLNNLGVLYQDMGEYGKALAMLERAKNLRAQALGESHPEYVISLNNLAELYRHMGEFDKALSLLQQARDLCKRTLSESHPTYANSLNNLAILYWRMGEPSKALTLFTQARDLNKRALGESHPRYANSLNSLANLYHVMGDYDKALPLFEQAKDLRKRVLGEAHPEYANSLMNLANLYRDRGDYDKALPLLEQARDLHKRVLGEAHPSYATSIDNLAGLYRATDDLPTAARLAEQSRVLWQAFLDRTFSTQSGRQRYNLLAQHSFALNRYLSFALDAKSSPERLYRAALAWKSSLAARAAEERLLQDRPELRPLAEQLRVARASLARLANRQPTSAHQQTEWRSLFDNLEKQKEDLEVRLAKQSAAYLRSLKLRQADAAQVSAALPRDTAFVDFLEYHHVSPSPAKKGPWKTEARLLAFVIRRAQPPALVQLGPARDIDVAVQAWRRAVKAYRDPQAAAAELSRRVWQPLQKHLAGAHTVLLAPDGPLCGLSFAALPGARANTYLLEDIALGYVTSGRQLLELTADDYGPRGQSLLAVGGLVYGEATKGYRYLPGTRLEAVKVSKLFHQHFPKVAAPRLLTGAAADADALKERLPPTRKATRPRYLHLATHGFFEPPSAEAEKLRWPVAEQQLPFELAKGYRTYTRNPLLLCGLVLSGANRDREKGILRGEEVAGLDLRGCEVAVLSACETALGKVADTEGVQGLQRAFQAAGARSLVVSLWKVHDAATSVLMEEFYTNLWQKKLSRLEALRQAQLTVLRNPGRVQQRQQELRKLGVRGPEDEPEPLPHGGRPATARSHPALWAAFILSGDAGPVANTSIR